jgi:hypothetical protein
MDRHAAQPLPDYTVAARELRLSFSLIGERDRGLAWLIDDRHARPEVRDMLP